MVGELGARFILDTSGEPLIAAIEKPVFLMKPNLAELGALVGRDELEGEEVTEAISTVIQEHPCEVLVVSLGAAGAYLGTAGGVRHVPAPIVKPRSTVGAGDSMVAGIVHGLYSGMDLPDAMRLGVACGSAATLTPGSELLERDVALRLYEGLKG